MRRSFYLLAFTIPLAVFISFYLKGIWSYFAIFYAFVFLPSLELLLPQLSSNLSLEEEDKYKKDRFFDLIIWSMVPIQLFLLFYFCHLVSVQPLTSLEFIGLISAMGLSCGVLGINVAHELGHRNNLPEQVMAKMLLSTSLYWHFNIEHNKGHHKNASTPFDPETSRLNESLYAFWYRSIKDSFISAFKIDPKEMILAISLESVLCFALYLFFGGVALFGFMMSALIGVILLESVNYIEHYGLVRKEIAPNRYEKVQPYHSWNADYILSRAVLFDLSRHSDHHANVNRKYQILRHHEESPQMPTGYPGMILLSLIPPLWFRVMNKKITELKFR